MQTIKRFLPGLDTMGLTLAMWMCTMPLIAFVIVPLFGAQVAISVAIGLLILMLAFCWFSCIPKVVAEYRRKRTPSDGFSGKQQ